MTTLTLAAAHPGHGHAPGHTLAHTLTDHGAAGALVAVLLVVLVGYLAVVVARRAP